MLLRFELHDVNINVTDIVAGMCGGYEIKRKMFKIQTMVAYLFCQQQYCDGVQHCTWKNVYVEAPHMLTFESVLLRFELHDVNIDVTDIVAGMCGCYIKRKMFKIRTMVAYIFVSNNIVIVYNTVHGRMC